MSNTQLGTCVLEVALCLSQQLLDDGKASDGSSYAVGESVMARRLDGEFGEGTVLDALGDGSYLVVWNEEAQAAKLDAAELMPFGSGMGLSTERRQRVAPAFILNNFLMKTAIPSNDLSRVQMVVRDGADVNCTDAEGNSPLNLAASSGASVALVQFLISSYACGLSCLVCQWYWLSLSFIASLVYSRRVDVCIARACTDKRQKHSCLYCNPS